TTLLTCSFLFSGLFTEMVQQIHSLRASGVISSHAANALESGVSAFRKSAGSSWTTPLEIFFAIGVVYKITVKLWAATGNRTLIESSTSSSVNRYTIAAIYFFEPLMSHRPAIFRNLVIANYAELYETTRTKAPRR